MKKDIYKKIARDVINTEIVSLNKLKNSLDINFKKAVEEILNCKNAITTYIIFRDGVIVINNIFCKSIFKV